MYRSEMLHKQLFFCTYSNYCRNLFDHRVPLAVPINTRKCQLQMEAVADPSRMPIEKAAITAAISIHRG
jgi:hypothetical protein